MQSTEKSEDMEKPEQHAPYCFVVFPPNAQRPRKFTRYNENSYDEYVLTNFEWHFFDNVSNDTATWWYRISDCEVFTKMPNT